MFASEQPVHPSRGIPFQVGHHVLIPGQDPGVGVAHDGRSHRIRHPGR
jgi:hypothetical protein